MTGQKQKNLAASCGVYCGACPIYITGKGGDSKRLEQMARAMAHYLGRAVDVKDLACEGCLSEVVAVHSRDCALRACAFEKGLTRCAECPDFPCQRIIDFTGDGVPQHGQVLNSIRRQQEIGIDAWIEEQEERQRTRLDFKENCGVCGRPLIHETEPVSMRCVFCGKKYSALIHCPESHYICDSCHEREALDILRQVLNSSTSTDPTEILERVMSHPSVPMHGPEHHAMVPAAIVAAVCNAGYSIPKEAVEIAVTRGSEVPGGWCGFYGACGAAVGVGIAVSVLTKATPLTGKQRSLAMEATSLALARMLDGHPQCCKRASRNALEAAVEFLRDRMGMTLGMGQPIRCSYSQRNQTCPREECPYYVRGSAIADQV